MKRREVEELLNEKRTKNGRKRVKIKILAGILTITLIGGMAGSYYTIRTRAADGTVQTESDTADQESALSDIIRKQVSSSETSEADKEETVYVNADATGATQNITVSDVLKNSGSAATIKDASSLDNMDVRATRRIHRTRTAISYGMRMAAASIIRARRTHLCPLMSRFRICLTEKRLRRNHLSERAERSRSVLTTQTRKRDKL